MDKANRSSGALGILVWEASPLSSLPHLQSTSQAVREGGARGGGAVPGYPGLLGLISSLCSPNVRVTSWGHHEDEELIETSKHPAYLTSN